MLGPQKQNTFKMCCQNIGAQTSRAWHPEREMENQSGGPWTADFSLLSPGKNRLSPQILRGTETHVLGNWLAWLISNRYLKGVYSGRVGCLGSSEFGKCYVKQRKWAGMLNSLIFVVNIQRRLFLLTVAPVSKKHPIGLEFHGRCFGKHWPSIWSPWGLGNPEPSSAMCLVRTHIHVLLCSPTPHSVRLPWNVCRRDSTFFSCTSHVVPGFHTRHLCF